MRAKQALPCSSWCPPVSSAARVRLHRDPWECTAPHAVVPFADRAAPSGRWLFLSSGPSAGRTVVHGRLSCLAGEGSAPRHRWWSWCGAGRRRRARAPRPAASGVCQLGPHAPRFTGIPILNEGSVDGGDAGTGGTPAHPRCLTSCDARHVWRCGVLVVGC